MFAVFWIITSFWKSHLLLYFHGLTLASVIKHWARILIFFSDYDINYIYQVNYADILVTVGQ